MPGTDVSGMGGERRECDFDAEARRRGDKRGEAAKSREDERGDSGGWWPSVRSGRAFRRATSGEAVGKSRPWWESVILTRRRGDAETSAEKRRSQERTSAETAEDGGLRCGADALFGEQLAEKQRESQNLRGQVVIH